MIEPWQPKDTLAVLRLMAYTWGTGWEDQLRQALAAKLANVIDTALWFNRYTGESQDILSLVPTVGATTVAVSAARSTTGSAMLATSVTDLVRMQSNIASLLVMLCRADYVIFSCL